MGGVYRKKVGAHLKRRAKILKAKKEARIREAALVASNAPSSPSVPKEIAVDLKLPTAPIRKYAAHRVVRTTPSTVGTCGSPSNTTNLACRDKDQEMHQLNTVPKSNTLIHNIDKIKEGRMIVDRKHFTQGIIEVAAHKDLCANGGAMTFVKDVTVGLYERWDFICNKCQKRIALNNASDAASNLDTNYAANAN